MTFDIKDNLDRKFELGRTVSTPGALREFGPEFLGRCLARHMSGDWGELDRHDIQVNEAALENGDRIMSVYSQNGKALWIITDGVADSGHREVTTFLLPEDY